mmetsp:Transcript_101416/g.241867  ORF Transcript_101416/g.241867 Transcript_101416/m.241867 type:complete len:264 (-) Transcript_101416:1942-2733(-)
MVFSRWLALFCGGDCAHALHQLPISGLEALAALSCWMHAELFQGRDQAHLVHQLTVCGQAREHVQQQQRLVYAFLGLFDVLVTQTFNQMRDGKGAHVVLLVIATRAQLFQSENGLARQNGAKFHRGKNVQQALHGVGVYVNELLSKAVVVAELANDNAGLGQEPFLGNAAQGCTLYALALLGGGSHLRVGRGEYVIEQGNKTCAGNDTPVVWLFGQVDQKHHRVVAQVVILCLQIAHCRLGHPLPHEHHFHSLIATAQIHQRG